MKKNDVLLKLMESLTDQRDGLVRELSDIDYNLNGWMDEKMTLENQIMIADGQILNLIGYLENDNDGS